MTNTNVPNKIDEIISGRLCGEPVTSIANRLGLSRQYIYTIIGRLPKGTFKVPKGYSLTREQEKNIVLDFLDRIPSASYIKKHGNEECSQAIVSNIAKTYGLSEKEVLAALHKVTDHHPTITESPFYSAIFKWRSEQAVSLTELAEYANCSVPKMRDILRGWYHLPLSAALGIKKHSGLTLSEIYSDLIRLDQNSEGVSE